MKPEELQGKILVGVLADLKTPSYLERLETLNQGQKGIDMRYEIGMTGTGGQGIVLMGSIMAVGIATSNSILLVNFANDLRVERGISPLEAALEAGRVRLRPVLMTALAMILGMLPMAMGIGDAGKEMRTPLGIVSIGGLAVSTILTLFVIPAFYYLGSRKKKE
jgi:HAE1 family hydrophobic/amphiphilic exporter-1